MRKPSSIPWSLLPALPLPLALALSLPLAGVALADVAPEPRRPVQPQVIRPSRPPAVETRDPIALARREPSIAKLLDAARGGSQNPTQTGPMETAVQVKLSEQCGFAGCGSSTLVAFTFRSQGPNPMTHTVLALVSCDPVPSVPCKVAPADVRPVGALPQK